VLELLLLKTIMNHALNELRVMQWNACSLQLHAAELKQFLSESQSPPQIICVEETFLKPAKTFKLDGYDVVRKDREGHGGGLATLIRTGIQYTELDSPGARCTKLS